VTGMTRRAHAGREPAGHRYPDDLKYPCPVCGRYYRLNFGYIWPHVTADSVTPLRPDGDLCAGSYAAPVVTR